jgi:hypothetical protein
MQMRQDRREQTQSDRDHQHRGLRGGIGASKQDVQRAWQVFRADHAVDDDFQRQRREQPEWCGQQAEENDGREVVPVGSHELEHAMEQGSARPPGSGNR